MSSQLLLVALVRTIYPVFECFSIISLSSFLSCLHIFTGNGYFHFLNSAAFIPLIHSSKCIIIMCFVVGCFTYKGYPSHAAASA